MVSINFDATQVEPSVGYEPVPEGWYNVAISKSEMKATKSGDGAYLQFDLKIMDGPQAGKVLFARLNIQNPNQQAVDIAQKELSAICHVTGVYMLDETTKLHGIPFQVKAIVSQGDKGPMNELKGYRDQMGNEPGKSSQAGMTAAPQPQQAPQGVAQSAPAFAPQAAPQPQPTPQPQPQPQYQPQQAPQPENFAAPQPQPQPQQQPPQQGAPAWGNAPQQPQQAPQAAPAQNAPASAPWGTPTQ